MNAARTGRSYGTKLTGPVCRRTGFPGTSNASPGSPEYGGKRMAASGSRRPVTLAELVATLSLAADLGMGRPMERVLRQTVVAMRLGAAAGTDQADCSSAYYTSLL